MKHFVLHRRPDSSGRVAVDGRDFHYLVRVRRMKPGDELTVLVDERQLSAVIESIGTDSLVVRTGGDGSHESATAGNVPSAGAPSVGTHGRPKIRLLLGYPKGKKLELAIRQATEFGTDAIFPVLCDNSVPDPDTMRWSRKAGRLDAIAREAVQQSGAPRPPVIHPPASCDEVLRAIGSVGSASAVRSGQEEARIEESVPSVGVFFHEKRLDGGGLQLALRNRPGVLYVMVGPEGGISPREVELLIENGFLPAFFGPTILRCDTAVSAALGAVCLLCEESEQAGN